MNRSRLLTLSPLWMGSLFYWFYWTFIAAYDPFLNVYLSQELGLSGFEIGVLAVFAPLTALLFAPPISALADRRGWRLPLLQLALIGWVITLFLFRYPQSFWALIPAVLLLALFRSPTAPIGDSLVAQMSTTHRLSYGSMRLWGSLGFALMSIIGGWAWQRFGYAPMFIVAAILAVPCILLITRMEDKPAVRRQTAGSARLLLRDPGMVTLFAVAFLAGVSLISTYIFGGIFMEELGGGRVYVGLMFGLSALTEVPIMFASGRIMGRLTAPRTMLLSLFFIALSVYGHTLSFTPLMLLVAAILKGVGYGLFFVTLIYLINERAPNEWKATAQSIMNACFVGLAPLFTSAISGYVFDHWGGRTMFAGTASFTLAAIAWMAVALARGWLNPAPALLPEPPG